jgi:aminopeptidase N
MKLIFLLLLGVVAFNATPIPLTPFESQVLIQADIDSKQSVPDYRLNDNVLPLHYDLEIKPYFTVEGSNAAFTFDGKVKILVKTTRSNVTEIVLHANRLTIANDWIVYAENDQENPIPHPIADQNEETHKLTLNLDSPLEENVNYVIEINYVGEMSNDMYGFYRTSYTENGVTK